MGCKPQTCFNQFLKEAAGDIKTISQDERPLPAVTIRKKQCGHTTSDCHRIHSVPVVGLHVCAGDQDKGK